MDGTSGDFPRLGSPGIPSGGFIKDSRRVIGFSDPASFAERCQEPLMEGLIQLVTESLARHGIKAVGEPQTTESVPPAEASLPAVLPEHNYRKSHEVSSAP